ncbi:MAG: ComF family protein [Aristaeellaceae bacterium]
MRAADWLRRVDAAALAALYPRETLCLCCGMLTRGESLCEDCRDSLNALRLTGRLCPLCGHPMDDEGCSFCHGQMPCRMQSVWRHEDVALLLVHQLKYQAVADCALPLAQGIAALLRTWPIEPDTLVTWVTMPERRQRERGIDHGRLLAEETARLLGLSCPKLLTRRSEGPTQHGLSREERLRNLTGAFCCEERITRPVLLVDDVMTTSATARQCARCLLAAGAPAVTVVTATQAGG